jgi:hypothetical protein
MHEYAYFLEGNQSLSENSQENQKKNFLSFKESISASDEENFRTLK